MERLSPSGSGEAGPSCVARGPPEAGGTCPPAASAQEDAWPLDLVPGPPPTPPFMFVDALGDEALSIDPARFLPIDHAGIPGFSRFSLALHPPGRAQHDELRQYKTLCDRLLPGTRYGSHLYTLVYLDPTTFTVTLSEYGEVIGGATVRFIQATCEPVLILDVLLLAVEQTVSVCGRGYATRIMNYLRTVALELAQSRGSAALVITQSDAAGGRATNTSVAMSFWSRQRLYASPHAIGLLAALHAWDKKNSVYHHSVPMLAWLLPHSASAQELEVRISERAQQTAVVHRDPDYRATRHTRRVTILLRGAPVLLPPLDTEPAVSTPSTQWNRALFHAKRAADSDGEASRLQCKSCSQRDEGVQGCTVCFTPYHFTPGCMPPPPVAHRERAREQLRSARLALAEVAVGQGLPQINTAEPDDAREPVCTKCVEVIVAGGAEPSGGTHDSPLPPGVFLLPGGAATIDCQAVLDRLLASSRRWREHVAAVAAASAIRSRYAAVRVRLGGVRAHVCGSAPTHAAPSRAKGRGAGRGRGGRRGRASLRATSSAGEGVDAPPLEPPPPPLSGRDASAPRAAAAAAAAASSGVPHRHARLAAAVAAASGDLFKAACQNGAAEGQGEARRTGRKRQVRPEEEEAPCVARGRGGGRGRGRARGRGRSNALLSRKAKRPRQGEGDNGVCYVDVPGEGRKGVVKVLKHHVYGGAQAGSLFNVYVRVMYEGGRRSNGFIAAEMLAGSEVLRQYTLTDTGERIAKYL
ncbi:hypothetical protein AB1Y20_005006 [Prymnesium parvum]|uniref:Histone acetyltransferase n=1 Tax=Prymnesium parvum TaxID=97485 RepID=A0AB34J4Z9_PRYPA